MTIDAEHTALTTLLVSRDHGHGCVLNDLEVRAVLAEIERLRAELERERMRLAACGVIALANTPESAAKARAMHPDYHSASCDDVVRCVDENMRLRAERDALFEVAQAIEGALRFAPAAEVLDEHSPIRDGLRAALAQAKEGS